MKSKLFSFLGLLCCLFSCGFGENITAKPSVVNVGALFAFNSTIGRVAKVAIAAAVDDVNSDSRILSGMKLVVEMQDTNHSGFIGIVEALQFMGMEKDIVALIGPQSSVHAHVISLVANELHVPLLSYSATDPTLLSLEYPYFMMTCHSDDFQMTAVADLVDYYQWNEVIALFIDDDGGRNAVASLGEQLAERRCKISYKGAMRAEANRSEITDLLVQVAMMESRVIVVQAYPDTGAMIFSVAKMLGMMSNGYVWIATDWLSSLLDSSPHPDEGLMEIIQGVLVLRQHTADSKRKAALAAKWSKLTQNDVGLSSYGLYAYDTVWVIAHGLDAFFSNGGNISFSRDPNIQKVQGNLHLEALSLFDGGKLLLDRIHQVNFTGITGRVAFDSDKNLIRPAYDILNIIGTRWQTVGYWTNHSGLSIVPPEVLYTKTPNNSHENQKMYSVIWPGETITKPRGWVFPSNGVELRIGVPNRVSYVEFVSEDPMSGLMKGFCIDVFVAAVNLLPYPLPYRLIPYGDGHENPSYTQLVENILSNEFDAAIGDITIVTNRTKIVDFTQPYIESGLVVLTSVTRQSSNAWVFLQPFTLQMWCVTGLLFLVIGAVIWILEHRINDDFRGPPKKQLMTIFWFSLSTLFFSHRENTVTALGRTVLIIWLFVVLIIQSSYTANLTSILTVQQLSSPVKGIDSLIASDEPIGYQVGSFSPNYMVEELGIARSRLKALGTPKDYARALELGPRKGGVAAVVDERPYVDLFLSTNCKFAIVGSEFTRNGWGFAFPRDSQLAVDLSTAILTLAENGDLQRIHEKWLTSSSCSSQDNEIQSNQLQMYSFSGLFLICGVACFIALAVYFFRLLRQFCRHAQSEEISSSSTSSDGSSHSIRRLQAFLSFADKKEIDTKMRNKDRQMQDRSSNGGVDIENC